MNKSFVVRFVFLSLGSFCCLPLKQVTDFRADHTHAVHHVRAARVIYSSNQSHVEAVLPDRLAYFLSPWNISFSPFLSSLSH